MFEGVTFNIPQATVTKDGNKIRVNGNVIRHRKLVGNIPTTGLSIPYDFTFENGQIIETGSQGPESEVVGNRLGKMIAQDVYNESRDEAQ